MMKENIPDRGANLTPRARNNTPLRGALNSQTGAPLSNTLALLRKCSWGAKIYNEERKDFSY